MRKVIILPLAIVVAGIFIAATTSQSFAQEPQPRKIEIKMFEVDADHFRFDPAGIHLKLDEPVELVFVNTGTRTNEFASPLFALLDEIVMESAERCPGRDPGSLVPCIEIKAQSLREVEVRPGKSVSLKFTPAGDWFEAVELGESLRFFLGCFVTGHLERGMRGVIVIEQ